MHIRNTLLRYGAVAQFLHWLIVALIITQFILASKADDLPLGPAKIGVLAHLRCGQVHRQRRWCNEQSTQKPPFGYSLARIPDNCRASIS